MFRLKGIAYPRPLPHPQDALQKMQGSYYAVCVVGSEICQYCSFTDKSDASYFVLTQLVSTLIFFFLL